jgi:hypothetical protein
MGSCPTQRKEGSPRRERLEPPMQSNAYPIRKNCLTKNSEWAESYGTGFQVRKTALANQTIYFARVVPFRPEP